MPERHQDWLRQARLDLEHAGLAARAGHLEWVFAAQQAAEKACKALHLSLGGEAWGHDLTALLHALPVERRAPAELADRAKALDKHYVLSRYPNGFAQGIPREHYTRAKPSRRSETRRRSLSSVRVRYLNREAVISTLRQLAAKLGAERSEVLEVRLFGSLARGERNPRADADLLVVLEASDVPFRDRLPLYKPVGSPVPIDLTACTREELEREIAAGNRFIQRVLAESLLLYARDRDAPPRGASGPSA